MKRATMILCGILLVGVAVSQAVFWIAHANVHAIAHSSSPELEWLKREFEIEGEQWEAIRNLHLIHDKQCIAYCEELDASNEELLKLMRASREITPELEESLRRATDLRERCRKATLKHIYDVSREMSPEAGGRYLEMMTMHLIDDNWHDHLPLKQNAGDSPAQGVH